MIDIIKHTAKKYLAETIEIRRFLHKNPELSFKEFRTAKLVAEKLESLGIAVKTGVGKTGVVGDLIGNEEGQGFYQMMNQLPWERLLIGITALGAIDFALQETIKLYRIEKHLENESWTYKIQDLNLQKQRPKQKCLDPL